MLSNLIMLIYAVLVCVSFIAGIILFYGSIFYLIIYGFQ